MELAHVNSPICLTRILILHGNIKETHVIASAEELVTTSKNDLREICLSKKVYVKD